MRFAATELSSGIIFEKTSSPFDLNQAIICAAGASNEQRWLQIPDGSDENHLKCSLVTIDGFAQYIIEEDSDAKNTADWAALRAERNKRLSACDWTQMADSPLSTQQKETWQTYRTDLRNLPEVTISPSTPNWPLPPN